MGDHIVVIFKGLLAAVLFVPCLMVTLFLEFPLYSSIILFCIYSTN